VHHAVVLLCEGNHAGFLQLRGGGPGAGAVHAIVVSINFTSCPPIVVCLLALLFWCPPPVPCPDCRGCATHWLWRGISGIFVPQGSGDQGDCSL
jgi:hypothetical protein